MTGVQTCALPIYLFDRAPDSYPEWERIAAQNPWARFDTANEVLGLDGLLQCMRSTFLCAQSPDELDRGLAAMLAVPDVVARQVAGIGALAMGQKVPAAVPLASVISLGVVGEGEGESALRDRIKGHKSIAKSGHRWPGGIKVVWAEMLRQYEERMQLKGASAEVAEEQISYLWEMAPNTVHVYLKDARKESRKAASTVNLRRA